jgi:hypothetical protein
VGRFLPLLCAFVLTVNPLCFILNCKDILSPQTYLILGQEPVSRSSASKLRLSMRSGTRLKTVRLGGVHWALPGA